MSNESSVSMRELELESAELLPSRETLNCCKYSPAHSSGPSFTQVGGSSSAGLINVPIASGDNIDINVLGFGF
jgi:hypothetical protein